MIVFNDIVVIVTGSRHWSKPWRVHWILDSYMPRQVVEGGARGADAHARQWLLQHGLPTRSYNVKPEDWRVYGKAAGPRRNGRMLRDYRQYPNVRVIGFPEAGGSGTQDCMCQAMELGMVVENYGDVEVQWSGGVMAIGSDSTIATVAPLRSGPAGRGG